jgi:hypothetical protein
MGTAAIPPAPDLKQRAEALSAEGKQRFDQALSNKDGD